MTERIPQAERARRRRLVALALAVGLPAAVAIAGGLVLLGLAGYGPLSQDVLLPGPDAPASSPPPAPAGGKAAGD